MTNNDYITYYSDNSGRVVIKDLHDLTDFLRYEHPNIPIAKLNRLITDGVRKEIEEEIYDKGYQDGYGDCYLEYEFIIEGGC